MKVEKEDNGASQIEWKATRCSRTRSFVCERAGEADGSTTTLAATTGAATTGAATTGATTTGAGSTGGTTTLPDTTEPSLTTTSTENEDDDDDDEEENESTSTSTATSGASTTTASNGGTIAPTGWVAHGGQEYQLFGDGDANFDEAVAFCENEGGSLASVGSASEHEFVAELVAVQSEGRRGNDRVWIGGVVDGDTQELTWVDGSDAFDFGYPWDEPEDVWGARRPACVEMKDEKEDNGASQIEWKATPRAAEADGSSTTRAATTGATTTGAGSTGGTTTLPDTTEPSLTTTSTENEDDDDDDEEENESTSTSTATSGASTTTASNGGTIAPTGWVAHGGQEYQLFGDGDANFDEAVAFCENEGGSLASVGSASEHEFVAELVAVQSEGRRGNDRVWIGGVVDGDTQELTWVDGSDAFDFGYPWDEPEDVWGGRRPGCVEMKVEKEDNGASEIEWKATRCSRTRSFVCERGLA
ncbi:hypothetical protein PTSG_04829 [Salpingoeca rosetta]|uniref:C-type lectin domain-containing protein n=1 Tax=Salpingoeca rosetta (strain ATCC 50818 / BSB-021) TaxID=946362 RepID=F2U9T8_SALR5|nr:uncharacterized protein PTSG_04829 [Salpingoeca rosetta]EGD73115.1 hypothetical protein PTSG_04829 [Salpingoeca rosetta]|eukprot:XP_004994146.1 hypothetical protein PTSG_04829 [Salpingoeca rosetta]